MCDNKVITNILNVFNKYSIKNKTNEYIEKNIKNIPNTAIFKEKIVPLNVHGSVRQYKLKTYEFTYNYYNNIINGGKLLMPIEKIKEGNFEIYFGFGCNCINYDKNCIIYVSPQYQHLKRIIIDGTIIIDNLKDVLIDKPINSEMLKFLLWLLMHGNYGNNIDDIDKINDELSEIIGCNKLVIDNPFFYLII